MRPASTRTRRSAGSARTTHHRDSRVVPRTACPPFAHPHTRVHLQAALTIINDIARTPHLRTQPRAATAAAAIGHPILSPNHVSPTTETPTRPAMTAASLAAVFEQ